MALILHGAASPVKKSDPTILFTRESSLECSFQVKRSQVKNEGVGEDTVAVIPDDVRLATVVSRGKLKF
jgi:hypothetical protein